MNLYAYAGSNPLSFIDPTGHSLGGVIGGVGGFLLFGPAGAAWGILGGAALGAAIGDGLSGTPQDFVPDTLLGYEVCSLAWEAVGPTAAVAYGPRLMAGGGGVGNVGYEDGSSSYDLDPRRDWRWHYSSQPGLDKVGIDPGPGAGGVSITDLIPEGATQDITDGLINRPVTYAYPVDVTDLDPQDNGHGYMGASDEIILGSIPAENVRPPYILPPRR